MKFNILVFPLLYVLLQLFLREDEYKYGFTYNHASFLEFTNIGDNSELEHYQYVDGETRNTYKLTHKTFNNGFTLMHLGGYENSRSELRLVISRGVSSDSLHTPGIRFLALSIFGAYVQGCMFDSSKGKDDLSLSIKSETLYSRVGFRVNGNSEALIECIYKAAKTKEKYYDLESNFEYLVDITKDFEKIVRDPVYNSVDIMLIKEFIRSKIGFESQVLQLCNAFSTSNYNKISLLKELMNKQIGEILKSLRIPSLLSIIYVGDMSYSDLQKRLFFFTGLKEVDQLSESINLDSLAPLREAIHSGRSVVSLRKNKKENIVRIFVPFKTDSLDLMVDNSFLFIIRLFDSRHRKGIINFLFANIFTVSTEVGYNFISGSMVLHITLRLTKKGRENIPIVVDSVFSYLNLIKKSVLSEKLCLETQQTLDEKIKKDPLYVSDLSELYFGVRKSLGLSIKNALYHNLDTEFNLSKINLFLSRMDLSSSFVLFTVKNYFSLSELFFAEKLSTTELFARSTAERYSNVIFTPFYADAFYNGLYSDFDPEHGRERYKLDLPYSDTSSSTSLPVFALDSMSSKVYLLHRAVSEAYSYIGSDMVVSKTMSFKSQLTERIWYSNTMSYGLNVDVLLRFSLWFWAPGFDNIFGYMENTDRNINEQISITLVSAIHVLSAYLKLETRQIFARMLRYDGFVGFTPSQTYFDWFSTPLELYLSVRAPTNYLTFIFDQIAQIFNKEISIDEKNLRELHVSARRSLLKHYQELDNNLFTSKLVSQMISPTQHTFNQIDKGLEEGVSLEQIRLVAKTIFNHSRLRGRIFGNITPFQANHALNVFLKSIDHAYFEDTTPSELPHSKLPFSGLYSSIDANTIPEGLKKTFYRRMDYVSASSAATIVLLIGPISLQSSYAKALILRELYQKIILQEFEEDDRYNFSTKVLFSVSEFVSVELSLKSNVEDTKELSKKLYSEFKDANKKIPKLLKSRKSTKKILLRAVENIKISESSFVFATFYHENLYKVTLDFIKGLYHADVMSLINGVSDIPNLLIAHHKVDNINAALESDDFVPPGYTVIVDPKELIRSEGVEFINECINFEITDE
ncbi:secreted insulinase like peptidase [Cryptosporidium xiaoi]|uniref:Secreted insulinase like peptidase n=1 Tax=Cryptosporidium xiaoi TaxID=659607 RepID=A0AAV9XWV5_9CRYT